MKNQSAGKQFLILSLYALLLTTFVFVFILCLLPPTSRDALVHHLALPKLYLEKMSLGEQPCLFFSYFPMNLDLLYGLALYLGSDVLPKFIHWGFGLLTALLIYLEIKSRLDRSYGIGGAVLFLTIPIIIRLSSTAYVDLGMIFFSTAAVFSLLRWAESNFKVRYILLSGLFIGLAMGTKYNGFISFALCFPIIFFFGQSLLRQGRFKQLIKAVSLFTLVSILVYSPWGIRNIIWTGNPVYPLFDNIIGQPYTPPCINTIGQDGQETNYTPLEYRRVIHGEDWFAISMIPFRIFLQGKDNDSRYFDGKLTPLLLFLPICFFAIPLPVKRWQKRDLVLFLFSWLYIALALISSVARVRYIGPAIPPLVVLSIYGFHQLIQYFREATSGIVVKKKLLCYGVVPGIAFFHLISSGQYMLEQYQRYLPWPYLSGQVSRAEYVKHLRPENHCLEVVNSRLKETDKILFIFMGQRGYYCDRTYIPDKGGNLRLLYIAAREYSLKKKPLTTRLLNEGINHFLMNNHLTHEAVERDLDSNEKQRFLDFIADRAYKLCDSHGYSLYRLNLE